MRLVESERSSAFHKNDYLSMTTAAELQTKRLHNPRIHWNSKRRAVRIKCPSGRLHCSAGWKSKPIRNPFRWTAFDKSPLDRCRRRNNHSYAMGGVLERLGIDNRAKIGVFPV